MATNWVLEQSNIYADLANEGVFFEFFRKGKGEYDPIQGAYAQADDLTFTASGIELRLTGNSKYSQQWASQLSIQEGDTILLIACGTYMPELEDKITLSGEDWAVKGWTTLRPGSVDLLRYVLIRKA